MVRDNDWYMAHKCHGCHYEYICMGITNCQVRRDCTEQRVDGTYYGEPGVAKWGEMSYNRLRPLSNYERIKRGE